MRMSVQNFRKSREGNGSILTSCSCRLCSQSTMNPPKQISTSAVPAAPLLVWPSFKRSPTGLAWITETSPFGFENGYKFAPDRCRYPTMLLMSANSIAESIINRTKAAARGIRPMTAIVATAAKGGRDSGRDSGRECRSVPVGRALKESKQHHRKKKGTKRKREALLSIL